jgi:hypothetical protein
MMNYISDFIDEHGHDLVFKSVYGLKVDPDPNREQRVKAVIASMGNKYLLAQPVQRKQNDRVK